MITYGTNPGMAIPISKSIPGSGSDSESSYQKALDYMEFKEGEMMIGKKIFCFHASFFLLTHPRQTKTVPLMYCSVYCC